ncbi:Methionyl-tRNA formyltransferase [Desulfatibacillum alkenivorans DSM 16219]|jgi:hypothetical protein|uniref:Methionyl-tRNA formyltransferase n=1 Tax=Desulfatibacillum alkenivorans DSM 16219 TaxID=1121393 RepID=A0A1M6Y7E0_9BACT|nr:hypothetical protein [Desulfatibacillum alkenivorans]SHL14093.1 Methionyl-tRNA formyltransferase [Desulfatibacillum alkenivorans DSM 16219]
MKLNNIKTVYLMGGGGTMLGFAKELQARKYEVVVFTSPRHSKEIMPGGATLARELDGAAIPWRMPEDVNTDSVFLEGATSLTMGIGFGEVWTFTRKTIDRFDGKLFDFMGIPLPRYRGGAHYTWQILRQNRLGACNIQVINEFMVQGEFDSGEIVFSREYRFPDSARIPQDYFNAAHKEELAFLKEFMDRAEQGEDFVLSPVPEKYSMYFPRLNTIKQGWIDWSWNTRDLALFINAFDDPYAGASTELDGRLVRLKQARIETIDGPFHPFMTGLVYRINSTGVYIATPQGSLIIGRVLDEAGQDMTSAVKTGQRFFTPMARLEAAMTFHAQYDAKGAKA